MIALCSILANAASAQKATHPDDPFESFNRASYQFNKKLDQYILKPMALTYDLLTPQLVKKAALNVFANMGEVPAMANDLLQGHPVYALSDLTRFGINSTIGIGGIFDVATRCKLPRRYNDFGITLAKWGVRHSPYLVIPFIGPSTFRDGAGLLINLRYLTLWPYIDPNGLRNTLFGLDIISLRATFLDTESIMNEAALDPYVFIRHAYLQKRTSLINERDDLSNDPEGLSADPLDDSDLDFALGLDDDNN